MSVDWRELLRAKTGRPLSAEPMLRYYAPLLAWLRQENRGRAATLADI
jgi:peptidyl-dipeptidase A